MSKALSVDLRVRVLSAVGAGATHREAAERFGVSAASVSRWRARARAQGDPRPKALGGDRKSGRIEAHKATILAVLDETPDLTLEEMRADLRERGLSFGTARSNVFQAPSDHA
jgi:transposase